MPETLKILISFTAGILLGAFYFSGLWYTVRRLPDSRSPVRLLALSFIIRLAAVLTGFYFIMEGQWLQLVAALLGFIIIRETSVRKLGRAA